MDILLFQTLFKLTLLLLYVKTTNYDILLIFFLLMYVKFYHKIFLLLNIVYILFSVFLHTGFLHTTAGAAD